MPSFRQVLEYAAYRSGFSALRALPVSTAERLGEVGGRRIFDFGGRRVEHAMANLRVAYPDLSEGERREIGRQSYVHMAWRILDLARAEHWSDEQLMARTEVSGLENVRPFLERGQGVLAVGLHLGSFELALRALPLYGIPGTMIGRPLRNPLLRRHMNAERTRTGIELIEHRNVAPRMLRALRKGRILGVLNDQYSKRSRGVFVPLFGARCSTSAGPATIALRAKAPVVSCYAVRVTADLHRIVISPPVPAPDTGDLKKDIEAATAQYNAQLESIIRKHPEQWMWSHRRFRHSPDLPTLY